MWQSRRFYFLLIIQLSCTLKRPRDFEYEWEPILRAATANVNLTPYANGRGTIDYTRIDNARDERIHHVVVACEPRMWEDAEYYDGGVKDPVYRFCIRLHEKHHEENTALLKANSQYSCRPDPKDTGGGKPEKRDWLCPERYPPERLLPPHGPPLESSCNAFSPFSSIPTWYTEKNPPEWCHYNWYERRQTCWCLPGYYRDSPRDIYYKPRGCPTDGPKFIMPQYAQPIYTTTPSPPPTPEPREGNFDADVGKMMQNNAIFAGILVLSILVYFGTRENKPNTRNRAD